MKVLILLGLVVASHAVAVAYNPAWWPSASNYETKDNSGNYAYGHSEANGPSFHRETGDASGRKAGSYGVRDNNGNIRIVEYVADELGFNAKIKTSAKLGKDHKDAANIKTTEMQHGAPNAYGHPFAYPYYAYPYYANV